MMVNLLPSKYPFLKKRIIIKKRIKKLCQIKNIKKETKKE